MIDIREHGGSFGGSESGNKGGKGVISILKNSTGLNVLEDIDAGSVVDMEVNYIKEDFVYYPSMTLEILKTLIGDILVGPKPLVYSKELNEFFIVDYKKGDFVNVNRTIEGISGSPSAVEITSPTGEYITVNKILYKLEGDIYKNLGVASSGLKHLKGRYFSTSDQVCYLHGNEGDYTLVKFDKKFSTPYPILLYESDASKINDDEKIHVVNRNKVYEVKKIGEVTELYDIPLSFPFRSMNFNLHDGKVILIQETDSISRYTITAINPGFKQDGSYYRMGVKEIGAEMSDLPAKVSWTQRIGPWKITDDTFGVGVKMPKTESGGSPDSYYYFLVHVTEDYEFHLFHYDKRVSQEVGVPTLLGYTTLTNSLRRREYTISKSEGVSGPGRMTNFEMDVTSFNTKNLYSDIKIKKGLYGPGGRKIK